jgi:hypothetical protein
MPESGLSGSVRGVPSNGHPYRDPGPQAVIGRIEIRQCGSLLPHRDVLSLLRGSTARMVRLWLVVLVAPT